MAGTIPERLVSEKDYFGEIPSPLLLLIVFWFFLMIWPYNKGMI